MKKEILIFAALLILTGCSATTSSSDIVDTVIATETNGTSTTSVIHEDSLQNTDETTDGNRSGLIRDVQKGWWKQHDARKEELQFSYDNGEISELEYLNELLVLEEEYYGWCSDEYNAVYARIEELNNQ